MIAGPSKLQLSFGIDCHGRGSFTAPPPSMASRLSSKEHNVLHCRSYGGRAGFDPHSDSLSFPELKASLVQNLIVALIEATEIIDFYAGPYGAPGAVEQLLGFEASIQGQNCPLSSHLPLPSEPLGLLLHERFSDGNSARAAVFSSPGDVAHAHSTVLSSSAVRFQNLSQGDQKRFVNNSISEEDLLLQEARERDFRFEKGSESVKTSSQGENLNSGVLDIASSNPNQVRSVSSGFLRRNAISTRIENASPFAGTMRLSQGKAVFWGWIALGTLLTGVLLVRPIFYAERQLRRPSVKRRILKSQWYGSPGSPSWEHKNFQMRVSECPQYPLLEVDGDKKLLRFPSDSTGASAVWSRRSSQPLERAQTSKKQLMRQTMHSTEEGFVSSTNKVQGKPIRQTIHSRKTLPQKQFDSMKAHSNKVSSGGASGVQFPDSAHHEMSEEESGSAVFHHRARGVNGRRVRELAYTRTSDSKIDAPIGKVNQGRWGKDDELDLDKKIQRLYQTIQAVEQHRRAAMLALEEERQRSLALEEEMSKQREVAAFLGEEVRLLKESHNALLASLQKKYSSPAAARTAADLVYQDWERHVAAEEKC